MLTLPLIKATKIRPKSNRNGIENGCLSHTVPAYEYGHIRLKINMEFVVTTIIFQGEMRDFHSLPSQPVLQVIVHAEYVNRRRNMITIE